MDELGQYLREHRKAKGITLEEIERVSNISVFYLRALEEGHYHVLPAPAFTIGFLKQYARCVGLDPEDAVLRYRRATQTRGGPFRERSTDKPTRGRRRPFWILAGSVLLLMVLWKALYPGRERTVERVRAIRIPRASLEETKKEELKKELGLLEGVPRNHVSSEGTATGIEPSVPGSKGRQEALPQTGSVEVVLQAIERTWVQIYLDQEPAIEKTLEPGERYPCRAREKVNLRIGNGKGVRVFYRGKVYENLGKKGDEVQISFPPSGNGS